MGRHRKKSKKGTGKRRGKRSERVSGGYTRKMQREETNSRKIRLPKLGVIKMKGVEISEGTGLRKRVAVP